MSVQLRVIIEEHDIRKLIIPSGIPNTVEELVLIIIQTFDVHEEYGLLYEDADSGNQFFSLTSTADLHDKATVKIIRKEPMVTLDLHPLYESGLSSTLNEVDSGDADEVSPQVDDCASSTSQDTIILPESCRSAQWPVPFEIPQFSHDIEIVLTKTNKAYHVL